MSEPTENALEGPDLVPGGVYAFRTAPLSNFAPPETGRHAAIKILAVTPTLAVFAVLDGIWPASPSLRETEQASILREHRFSHTGRTAVFGFLAADWSTLKLNDLRLLGVSRNSAEEATLAHQVTSFAIGSSISTPNGANHSAEGEWRWANDRAAFVAEQALRGAHNAAKRAAQEERYRTRLSKLTWDQLLAETPFERWTPSPPFPPEDFTLAARTVIHDACRALSALGPKPRKAEVRALLKGCVDWFNAADRAAGEVIETEEREDICAVLEEMAFVARQKALVDEIDVWREW